LSKEDVVLRFKKPKRKPLQPLHKQYLALAHAIDNTEAVDNREKFIALERLEESYMWLLKGVFAENGN
jgi:hypothetical protein